jgi:[acyl-carrier-protein] S-malonyltransferase
MGAGVAAARPDLLGPDADAVLGWSLSEAVTSAPEEYLTRTEIAQPALFAVSYALWELLAEALPEPPRAVAGHSVGEYAALAAAGVFSYQEGLALVAARGAAMAEAAAAVGGSMAALLGTAPDEAEKIAGERRSAGGQLWVANLNAPGQVVVAGADEDIAWLKASARELGVRRVIELKVAGAFHTPLMEPAADAFASALATASYAEPAFPVYGNVTAQPMQEMAPVLREQLVSPVRFADSLAAMAMAGVDTFIHVGPGNVTAGLAARTVGDAMTHVVQAVDDVTDVALALTVQ